jgi:acetyltransferase-like isoleucine patch superfamily enzyme
MKLPVSRRFKLLAVRVLPSLKRLGSGHDNLHRYSHADPEQRLVSITRGESSKIILTGKHTYGIYGIYTKSWGEGAHLFIGSLCSLRANLKVYLGGNHRTDWITSFPFGYIHNDIFPSGLEHAQDHPASKGHVIIENDEWIGESTTIMSGVRVGSGSVVAANSVVTKDVKPYTIVGGNPARLIKLRFPFDIVQQLLDLQWWHYSDDKMNRIVPLLQGTPDSDTLAAIKNI